MLIFVILPVAFVVWYATSGGPLTGPPPLQEKAPHRERRPRYRIRGPRFSLVVRVDQRRIEVASQTHNIAA